MIRGSQLDSLTPNTGLSVASLACSAVGDLLISASLCFFYHRNRTGVKRTDRILNLLILYAINTGLLTTIVAICTVILEVALRGTQWDTIPYFVLSKCYVNSVLATLNARTKLREMPWGFTTSEAVPSTGLSTIIEGKCQVQASFHPTSRSYLAAQHTCTHCARGADSPHATMWSVLRRCPECRIADHGTPSA